jgi:hypothetical protein
MEMDSPPEEWWQLDEVLRLLSSILEEPTAPHPGAGAAVSGGTLRNAHVHGLVRALDKLVGARKRFPNISRVAALHAWLYHLGGGEEANLLPPIAKTTDAGADRSKEIETAASKAAGKFFDRRAKLKLQVTRGCQAAALELDNLRSSPFNFSKMRKEKAASNPAALSKATASGGDGDPADPAMQERAERRAALAWVLACGTHPKSWLSPMRVFGGRDHRDILRFICELSVLENSEWIPRPQPCQQRQLAGHAWRMELERQAERAVSDALRASNDKLRTAAERSGRKEASARAALERGQERLERTLEAERKRHQVCAARCLTPLCVQPTYNHAPSRRQR